MELRLTFPLVPMKLDPVEYNTTYDRTYQAAPSLFPHQLSRALAHCIDAVANVYGRGKNMSNEAIDMLFGAMAKDAFLERWQRRTYATAMQKQRDEFGPIDIPADVLDHIRYSPNKDEEMNALIRIMPLGWINTLTACGYAGPKAGHNTVLKYMPDDAIMLKWIEDPTEQELEDIKEAFEEILNEGHFSRAQARREIMPWVLIHRKEYSTATECIRAAQQKLGFVLS